jgi:hypothetical protein
MGAAMASGLEEVQQSNSDSDPEPN